MLEAAEASFVVKPCQFAPIRTESDRESCDDDSTNSDNGSYDMNDDRIGQVDLWAFFLFITLYRGHLRILINTSKLDFKQFCFYFAARF